MARKASTLSGWVRELLPSSSDRRIVVPAVAPAVTPRVQTRRDYQQIVELMKREHHVRVRRWRNTHSGCAWEVRYGDGRRVRFIEAPRPRGPVSAAVFLHEVGHHAIGFDRYKPRCLEELMAWRWALDAMRQLDIAITPQVHRRVERSMRYAVAKARRRGIKRVPDELLRYVG